MDRGCAVYEIERALAFSNLKGYFLTEHDQVDVNMGNVGNWNRDTIVKRSLRII